MSHWAKIDNPDFKFEKGHIDKNIVHYVTDCIDSVVKYIIECKKNNIICVCVYFSTKVVDELLMLTAWHIHTRLRAFLGRHRIM